MTRRRAAVSTRPASVRPNMVTRWSATMFRRYRKTPNARWLSGRIKTSQQVLVVLQASLPPGAILKAPIG